MNNNWLVVVCPVRFIWIYYNNLSMYCHNRPPDQDSIWSSDVIYQDLFKWTREFHDVLWYSRPVSCEGQRQPSTSWRWMGTRRSTPPLPFVIINSLLLVDKNMDDKLKSGVIIPLLYYEERRVCPQMIDQQILFIAKRSWYYFDCLCLTSVCIWNFSFYVLFNRANKRLVLDISNYIVRKLDVMQLRLIN